MPEGWGEGVLPGTITSLDKAKALADKVDTPGLKKIQTVLTELTSVGSSLGNLNVSIDAEKLNKSIAAVGVAMDAIVGSKEGNVFDKIAAASSALATGKTDKIVEEANKIEKAISKSIVPALTAVQKMAAAAAKLEEALQRGSKIDIAATMKTFTSSLGKNMAASGIYTVQTKDVIVKVNLKVIMDAAELSKVIVQNKESVVRQRINLLMSAVGDDDGAKSAKEDAKKGRFTGPDEPSQMTTYMD